MGARFNPCVIGPVRRRRKSVISSAPSSRGSRWAPGLVPTGPCSRNPTREQYCNVALELLCGRRGNRLLAAVSPLAIGPIAFPVVPRKVEVTMLRHLHGNATGARFSVTATALPSCPVFGIDEISARRALDDHARLA